EAVADGDLLDLVVPDPRVLQRGGARLTDHVPVLPVAGLRLLELRHADADDVRLHLPTPLLRSRAQSRVTPRIRSATTFSWIWVVPPAMVRQRDIRKPCRARSPASGSSTAPAGPRSSRVSSATFCWWTV